MATLGLSVRIKHEMSGGHPGVETTKKQIVLGRDDQAEITGAAVGFYIGILHWIKQCNYENKNDGKLQFSIYILCFVYGKPQNKGNICFMCTLPAVLATVRFKA